MPEASIPSAAKRVRPWRHARKITLLSAVLTVSIGLLVLLGWIVNFPILTTLLPGFIRMTANTSVLFLCAGAGLVLSQYRRRHWQRAMLAAASMAIILVALATFIEYLTGHNLGIDQLLFADPTRLAYPGRMAPITTVSFVLAGLAELCLSLRKPARAISQALGLLIAFIALSAIAGYVYGVPVLYGGGVSNYTSMALHTGIAFTVLGIGLLCATPRHGFMRLVWGNSVGSLMIRHLAPAAIVIPLLLGALTTTRWFGVGDVRLKVALLIALSVFCFVAIIWLLAEHLHASEAERVAMQRKLLTGRTLYTEQLEKMVSLRTYELEQALTRTNAILESAADGMLGTDTYGRITFVNQAALNMLRVPAQELLDHNFELTVRHCRPDGNLYPSVQMPIFLAMTEDQIIGVNHDILRRADGTEFPIDGVATPIKSGGSLLGAMLAFRDISERLRLERIKSEFVSVVSHELRTPLTSIRGALGLVASGKLGELTPRTEHAMKIALNNTERLARLINDILDIERMDAGKLILNKQSCNTKEMVQHAAESVRYSAEQSLISLALNADEISLQADSDRIVQVLTNLMVNAIKFSPPHSTVYVQCQQREDEALFTVRDEGRGIPADKIDLIFERFQQLDSSDSREKGGCGLGLAISRGIVVQHGGSIWVESKPGKGSTFYFTIPCARSKARTQSVEKCETLI